MICISQSGSLCLGDGRIRHRHRRNYHNHEFVCIAREPHRLSLGLYPKLLGRYAVGAPVSSWSAPAASILGDEDVENFRVLTAVRSMYNMIVIIETPSSRLLLLDDTQNIHSILNKGEKWTSAYWDEFASLPAIIPQGPIAIFGLGGGTVAHLLLKLQPSLQIEGWELDETLIDRARQYLGLSDLEKPTEAGGSLRVCVGDALSASAKTPGGYAGIIVDLFSDGKVLPQLEEVKTWIDMAGRLMPDGRIMVNCGGSEFPGQSQHPTLKALSSAFSGQLNWKKTQQGNYLALTGPLPDLNFWSDRLPPPLNSAVKLWAPF